MKNRKVDDKKQKNLKRYKDIFDMCQKIMKTCNGEIKLRCSRVSTTLKDQCILIDRLGSHHGQFKEAVVKYHKNYIEKNKGEEFAFLKAVELYNLNGPSFDDVLNKELQTQNREQIINGTPRIPDYNHSTAYKKEVPCNRNFSTVTLSPIPCNMSTMIRNIDNSKIGDMSLLSTNSGFISPISIGSSIRSNVLSGYGPPVQKCYQHHRLNENHFLNKICNYCTAKDSKAVMYQCKICDIFIHDSCRGNVKHQICIPLKKISAKIAINCPLKLTDITTSKCQPMIPEVLLALMNHIHMLGLNTENVYTMTGKEKEVKELCNKLLEGKLKYLIKSDIRIVANAFIMILNNLKEPILPSTVIDDLQNSMDVDSSVSFKTIAIFLHKLPIAVQDTLIYVLLHLKVISMNNRCQFNSERLANTFSPILIKADCNMKTVQTVKMLIDLDIAFYTENSLISEKVFFMPYFKELSQ